MWVVTFRASAERELRTLPDWALGDLLVIADELAEDPIPEEAVLLRRQTRLYRLYFGHGRFRVIYRVDDRNRRVRIMRIRPRDSAYTGLR